MEQLTPFAQRLKKHLFMSCYERIGGFSVSRYTNLLVIIIIIIIIIIIAFFSDFLWNFVIFHLFRTCYAFHLSRRKCFQHPHKFTSSPFFSTEPRLEPHKRERGMTVSERQAWAFEVRINAPSDYRYITPRAPQACTIFFVFGKVFKSVKVATDNNSGTARRGAYTCRAPDVQQIEDLAICRFAGRMNDVSGDCDHVMPVTCPECRR